MPPDDASNSNSRSHSHSESESESRRASLFALPALALHGHCLVAMGGAAHWVDCGLWVVGGGGWFWLMFLAVVASGHFIKRARVHVVSPHPSPRPRICSLTH